MARTYKDMRFSAQRSAREIENGRQRKADRQLHTSVSMHFGNQQFRPTRLTATERPWRLAPWRLEGRA